MQLIRARRIGPGLAADSLDRLGIELADIGCRLRVHPAAARDGLRASFFERYIVEICIGSRREHLERERRGLREIACDHVDATVEQTAQQALETVDVHRFFQAVAHSLFDERVIGHDDVPDDVLAARNLIRKNGREQIFRIHACERGRHLLSAAETGQRERDGCIPTPPRREHRSGEQRLDEDLSRAVRMQVTRDVAQLEAMRGRERQHNRVLGCRGLKLEVERAAEAFAQREPPRAIDAASERRVYDELHAARFVEEALEHDRLLRRQATERGVCRGQVCNQLRRRGLADADSRGEIGNGWRLRFAESLRDLASEARRRGRELVGPPRSFAEPERNRGRLAVRILDAYDTAFDADDPVGGITELKYIACEAFDREVFVHRADEMAFRLEHHLIVGGIWNRTA